MSNNYARVVDPGHPLADRLGRVYVHRARVFRRIGPGSHPCRWCGRTLWWRVPDGGDLDAKLEVDHVDGRIRIVSSVAGSDPQVLAVPDSDVVRAIMTFEVTLG